MFKQSLFLECQNKDTALIILKELINKIDSIITSYDVCSSENGWVDIK